MPSVIKQAVPINFARGLDTKTDPLQVAPGNFLDLQNSIFTKAGLLQKRNGYQQLSVLPDNSSTFLTTYNNNLTAIGNNLYTYSASNQTWISKSMITPVSLSTRTVVRNNLNQQYADIAYSTTGAACAVYTENNNGTLSYKYTIYDSTTGQNIVKPTLIPARGVCTYAPKVVTFNNFFVIIFDDLIASVHHLSYVAIPASSPASPSVSTDIGVNYVPYSTGSFDAAVSNGRLYVAYNGNLSGGNGYITYFTNGFAQSRYQSFNTGHQNNLISISADETQVGNSTIYVASYETSTNQARVISFDYNINLLQTVSLTTQSTNALNITCVAQNQVCTVFQEISNNYGYDSSIATNYVTKTTVTYSGTASAPTVLARSVGLASKAFIVNGNEYVLCAYRSQYQPSYFLLQSTGQIVSRIAYQNGGGYYTTGLPSVYVNGVFSTVPYLYKDLIQAVNKNTNTPAGTQVNGIYSQTGVNSVTFEFDTSLFSTAEVGNNLLISGGFVGSYDGYVFTEQNFFLYPENVEASWSATGGSMAAKPDGATNTSAYYYQVTYEWTDNQGNAFKSAPSIPISVTTTGNASTGSITLNIPTLRLTYKTLNPPKIVIYRWSVGQQIYYQTTSISSPLLSNPTIDYVNFVDTNADSTILGNNILYTTGGVIEDIAPPATSILALYQSRLFLVDAEDTSLLWFSKQVIEATPVEMSDLFTIYIAPTTSAQGSTGAITALAPLDDKLIIFKKDAIYYINGLGPDNTGANNQFSEPIFITSTVGCANTKSIVFMPQGLMFQSDKGIWILGRDLSTNYIGAPVEKYNSYAVQSAVNVPGTNQVRFTVSNGYTLMYDYYYGQWGTFTGVPAIDSTLYQNLHTFIDTYGRVFQESPGQYLDGSRPVTMSFTTSWFNLAGLQGFERAYYFLMLANYISPHTISIQVNYDYNSSPSQSSLITPDNYSGVWGSDNNWGASNYWGGNPTLEQWRIFLNKQKIQAFQLVITENYDFTIGGPPGGGFTMSGLNLVVGLKKGFTPLKPSNSVG